MIDRHRTRVVVATHNPGKLAELRALLGGLPIDLVALGDLPGGLHPVVEDGTTFEANAEKKCRAAGAASGLVAIADDSGLEVDALGGRPGVWSARFAGAGATDTGNNERLLRELEGVPAAQRTARFRCVLALKLPARDAACFAAGTCEGSIALAPRGRHGFGYDPLFLPAERPGQTMAELDPADKNQLSHRHRAVLALRPALDVLLGAMDPLR